MPIVGPNLDAQQRGIFFLKLTISSCVQDREFSQAKMFRDEMCEKVFKIFSLPLSFSLKSIWGLKMALRNRECTALSQDLSLTPSIQLTTTCDSSSRGSEVSYHTHMCIIKNNHLSQAVVVVVAQASNPSTREQRQADL